MPFELLVFVQDAGDVVLLVERDDRAEATREPGGGGRAGNPQLWEEARIAGLTDGISNSVIVRASVTGEDVHA